MAAPIEPNLPSKPPIQVTMPDLVKFVRQLGHDLRNHLNAAELQAAYLAEIVKDPEPADEIKRLRAMISQVGASLQSVTVALGQPRLTLMEYGAADFIADLRQKLATEYSNETIEWDIQAGDASIEIDPQALQPALIELFANAFQHARGEGPIRVEARIEDGQFVFVIREPKQTFELPTEKWGREPLGTVTQGHYGLGLHRSRAILEAHHGQLSARYDKAKSSLITTITLPLSNKRA
ncbi:MAG TPA: ATP-binding protein [Chthoniobacterales bacterium]|nr:ATP-binding protein [Chthoniobacterales bacterium]